MIILCVFLALSDLNYSINYSYSQVFELVMHEFILLSNMHSHFDLFSYFFIL